MTDIPLAQPQPTHSYEENEEALKALTPVPNWRFWRRRRYCRIWQAALLSLNIEPSSDNRTALELADPVRFKEYEERREILIINRGHHSLLPTMKHLKEGEKPGEKYVGLSSVLDFAIEQRWSDIETFAQGMSDENLPAAPSGSSVRDTDEAEFDVHALPRGNRNAIVRLGAVITLLERLVQTEMRASDFLRGGELNHSFLAEEISKVIATAAGKEQHVPDFGPGANRAALAHGLKALGDFHAISPRKTAR